MDNSVIAKSGWLYKHNAETNWERNWVELYRDGNLKYYESDHSPNAEDVIFMPTECVSIKTGAQAETLIRAPEGHSSQCTFAISASNNKNWLFCGESLDDMRAWQLALEQARLLIVRPNYTNHASAMSRNYMNHMSSLPRLQQMQYSPYGHLPPTYLPAFSDGSQTYIPTLGSRAHHHFSSSMIHPNAFTSSQHNPRYPAMYPYQTQPHDLPGMATNAPGINGCPRPDGRDVAMGMLAGAAVGSMMYGPYFWW